MPARFCFVTNTGQPGASPPYAQPNSLALAQIKQFYTAPTLIRSLMAAGEGYVKDHDRSSLRVLGTVGEPINPEAWRWYHEARQASQHWLHKSACLAVLSHTGVIGRDTTTAAGHPCARMHPEAGLYDRSVPTQRRLRAL